MRDLDPMTFFVCLRANPSSTAQGGAAVAGGADVEKRSGSATIALDRTSSAYSLR